MIRQSPVLTIGGVAIGEVLTHAADFVVVKRVLNQMQRTDIVWLAATIQVD